jgi:hypothetical protein
MVTGTPRMVTDGLVLYVDAANTKSYSGSGTSWTDLSSTQTSGSLTNGPTFNTTNNGSIFFDGTNDFVDCGNNTIFNFAQQFTYLAWIYPSVLNTYKAIITHRNSASLTSQTSLFISPNSKLYYELSNNSLQFYSGEDLTLTQNRWQMVGVSLDLSGNANLYLNTTSSKPNASTILGPFSNFNQNIHIGRHTYSGFDGQYFSGRIAIVSIYNRALSATEVLQNFEATRERFGV